MRTTNDSLITDSLERRQSSEALLSEKADEHDLEKNSLQKNALRLCSTGPLVKFHRPLYLLYQTALIGLALFGVVGFIFPRASSLQQPWQRKDTFGVSYDDDGAVHFKVHPCDCGNSVAEALSNGCIYDELSAAWLPERCRDDELTAEFARLGDGPDGRWMYWADKSRTVNLTVHEASLYSDLQPKPYYMSREWHVKHCLYLWLKEHRFKINGKYFDPRADSDEHIFHCMMVLTSTNTHSFTSAGASLVG
ncbi:uncharacterized protein N7503_002989 [Penicillium pulvis]|uniref:uncharacterized protein n=1 Tax=Penicillium pulvis TaxID=1562058 RepID=UPI00254908A7|nr:uncharacterized protein N7503_002989 [Penicillium pulvis]KAJ5805387.1 hypothetical protein N7503_002989 [Penicillium pulvis]